MKPQLARRSRLHSRFGIVLEVQVQRSSWLDVQGYFWGGVQGMIKVQPKPTKMYDLLPSPGLIH